MAFTVTVTGLCDPGVDLAAFSADLAGVLLDLGAVDAVVKTDNQARTFTATVRADARTEADALAVGCRQVARALDGEPVTGLSATTQPLPFS